MRLEPLMSIEVTVGAPATTGGSPRGEVRLIPLTGGTFTGADGLSGRVLPGGADWQEIRSDGTLEISARYLLETTAGGVVEVLSTGVRAASGDVLARLGAGEVVDPETYYFRTHVRFRTSDAALLHLNDRLAVASGERLPDRVRLGVHLVT
jgi:hypothetical protein